jgi:Protein of unknown function (DUF3089)
MRRIWLSTSLLFVVFFPSSGSVEAAVEPQSSTEAPDYSNAANWVCRPGSEEVCKTGLDAMVVFPDGKKFVERFQPATDPPIDCFYVYPTVSQEQVDYADMTDTPEIQKTVKAQVGRLSSRCRIFAPIYRQATLHHLRERFTGVVTVDFDRPMLDVQAAWTYYLKHDNRGRGVILIGHSQGTILIQNLIAQSIDGTPSQALLVSAFLAGDPSLGIPAGKASGGTFAHVPVCTASSQTGCVYVWGSYLEGDTSPNRIFGKVRGDGLVTACSNPAAPSGGSGTLKYFHQRLPTAPLEDPPWVETVDQVSGVCQADSGGNAFRVSVLPGQFANDNLALIKRGEMRAGWGLHPLDVGLVQGNILDVIDAEIKAWRKHR